MVFVPLFTRRGAGYNTLNIPKTLYDKIVPRLNLWADYENRVRNTDETIRKTKENIERTQTALRSLEARRKEEQTILLGLNIEIGKWEEMHGIDLERRVY